MHISDSAKSQEKQKTDVSVITYTFASIASHGLLLYTLLELI